jgi:capsular polysaccharide transport system ATP-binding protein
MILLEDVHKRYRTDRGPGRWVLQGVSLHIPRLCSVGLVGRNGAGKSTLLRIMGGIDIPTEGLVERHCRVSWPLGFGGGLQGSLTGRQNTKFVCRLHGLRDDEILEKIEFIQEFTELGDAFNDPIKTYSSGMQARLKFALSFVIDFETYLVDELTAVGDFVFKQKSRQAFKDLVGRAGLIMVSHDEKTLKQYCQAGIFLHEGRAYWFDEIQKALVAYRKIAKV